MLIKRSLVALVAIVFALTSMPGCILDPKETVEEEKKPPVTWPDRTEKEDIIEIILLVHQTEDIEKYKEVLLKPSSHDQFPEGYIWFHQVEDFDELQETSLSYTQDWQGTAGYLDHETGLELRIFPGTWDPEDTFRGEDCTDCWTTTRKYELDIHLDDGKHYYGDFFVLYVIGPDPDNEDKYVLYAARDLRQGAH
jgi:hypothetical protein